MIIDNTYFKNEIYIPHAKPSVVKGVVSVSNEIDAFINKYTEDCLIKCLGYPLFKEFASQLDFAEDNGLKPTADAKWDDLLNGKEYTDANGLETRWRGIRYQNFNETDSPYDMSFLAYYVYFYYERNADTGNAGVGQSKAQAKNADRVSPNQKITFAWQNFFEIVQDKTFFPTIYENRNGLGIDWQGMNTEQTLYSFINYMNELDPATYPNFTPKNWSNINQFGI